MEMMNSRGYRDAERLAHVKAYNFDRTKDLGEISSGEGKGSSDKMNGILILKDGLISVNNVPKGLTKVDPEAEAGAITVSNIGYDDISKLSQIKRDNECGLERKSEENKIFSHADLDKALQAEVIVGVGPAAATEINKNGGKQSKAICDITLIPPKILLEIAKVFTTGADKYGKDNPLLIPSKDHINHALVHLFAHLAGDRQEGDIGHLTHAITRLIMAAEGAGNE